MSIWKYLDRVENRELIADGLSVSNCLFCKTSLSPLLDQRQDAPRKAPDFWVEHLLAKFCPTCGWWLASRTVRERNMDGKCSHTPRVGHSRFGTIAILRNLDMADLSVPIEEVRDFLVAKYESRYDVHPRLFEETVASVFRDLDYQAKVTAYSGDGGIDIVLVGKDDKEIGVQVKRYRNSIGVEQIRALTGALVLSGYTKGTFVTTSRFQAGANKAANLAALRGIQIELLNAERFYDVLKLAQCATYRNTQDLGDELKELPLVSLSRSAKW